MEELERLGAFYLGKHYDLNAKTRQDDPLLYDSKDLVTHAVCIGMTGSGKTGLVISLLEEAAIDGIPTIAIDPKGDLTNLLLTFPGLSAQEFRPWVNEDEAAKAGVDADAFAAQQAETWTKGLAEWGQDAARIKRLRDAAEFAIYTPGSTAGIPVSILRSLGAPAQAIRDDDELLAERATTTATGLLTLLGVDADPVKSREHILVATLFTEAWKRGADLDLASLIAGVQHPPMEKVGVLDLESFFPEKDRFELATAMNNLLAAPGFATWLEGEALDVGKILHTAEGKPRVAVFTISHLDDAQRMFFVALLLNEVLGWMRGQQGTSSLRAILAIDEVFGFLPPVAEPPSKRPLLTLLKQARAFGLGVLVATQNPVDLDYKGLANAGTWFLGRLQTERDKDRVLEGLEGVAAGGGVSFDRAGMEETLAGLGKRVFLLHDVHEEAPVVFETRWAMSYLRGPLTRDQIGTLMEGRTPAAPEAPSAAPSAPAGARPVVAPGVPERFFPAPAGTAYRPMLYAAATVRYADAKMGIDQRTPVAVLLPPPGSEAVAWESGTPAVGPEALAADPAPGTTFGSLDGPAAQPASYAGWSDSFEGWVKTARPLRLLRSPSTGITSQPGEDEGAFRVRLREAGREARDAAVAKLREKYEAKVRTLTEKIRKAEGTVDREKEQARGEKMQTAVSLGATILDAVLGRKGRSGTLGRATTTARGVERSVRQGKDVKRAEETVAALQQQLAELQAELQSESQALGASADTEQLETVDLPAKEVDSVLVALAWTP